MAYFADTWFWLALINKKDSGHAAAQKLQGEVGDKVVTSQLVLVELMAACSKVSVLRKLAVDLKKRLDKGPIKVIPNSPEMFERAFAVYAKFADKEWSLVDCASFEMMRDEQLTEVLTNDGPGRVRDPQRSMTVHTTQSAESGYGGGLVTRTATSRDRSTVSARRDRVAASRSSGPLHASYESG